MYFYVVGPCERARHATLTVDDCPGTLDTDPYAPPPPLGVTEWSGNRSRTGGKSSKRSGAERAWQSTVMQMRERSAEREVAEWER